MRDSSAGWDLGPDLDHFSSRTRQVLQYMNPNKINMDLLVDLVDYLGTKHHHAHFHAIIKHGLVMTCVKSVCGYVYTFFSPQINPHSLQF